MLLMDNRGPHGPQERPDLLRRARCRVVTFGPQTTNSFQVLHFTLFGGLSGGTGMKYPLRLSIAPPISFSKSAKGFGQP
jgi:hypothetical protein